MHRPSVCRGSIGFMLKRIFISVSYRRLKAGFDWPTLDTKTFDFWSDGVYALVDSVGGL